MFNDPTIIQKRKNQYNSITFPSQLDKKRKMNSSSCSDNIKDLKVKNIQSKIKFYINY
jgi:hypothetical protein